jgi:hypothetical protein
MGNAKNDYDDQHGQVNTWSNMSRGTEMDRVGGTLQAEPAVWRGIVLETFGRSGLCLRTLRIERS